MNLPISLVIYQLEEAIGGLRPRTRTKYSTSGK